VLLFYWKVVFSDMIILFTSIIHCTDRKLLLQLEPGLF